MTGVQTCALPISSWLLDEDTCQWVCPVIHPNEGATDENPGDGNDYVWDDETVNWIIVE